MQIVNNFFKKGEVEEMLNSSFFLEIGIPDIHQAKQTYAEYLLK